MVIAPAPILPPKKLQQRLKDEGQNCSCPPLPPPLSEEKPQSSAQRSAFIPQHLNPPKAERRSSYEEFVGQSVPVDPAAFSPMRHRLVPLPPSLFPSALPC